MKYPHMKRAPGKWKYELLRSVHVPYTLTGQNAMIMGDDGRIFATLSETGDLTVHKGYAWDLATGAIDTPDMLVPSLVHDVICQMTDEGDLPWFYRKLGDELFVCLLGEYETPRWRRTYCYLGVRLYSWWRGVQRRHSW